MGRSIHWIVAADVRRAALFGCKRLPSGDLRLEPQDTIENAHESEHEHGRPVLRGGAEKPGSPMRSSGHAAPHAVSAGHTAEEEETRFAREVGDWLRGVARALGPAAPARGSVTVFAPPRFLGLLRKHAGDLGAAVDLREGELAQVPPHELATHPAVLEAVHAGAGR